MHTRSIGRIGLALLLASLLLSVIGPRWFADAYWGTARAGMMNGTNGMLGAAGMMNGMMGAAGMMGTGMLGRGTGMTTTEPFDQSFLDEMIMHHQGAVTMAQHMIADSPREELRDLAQQIITAQQREIVQMQQWRQEWYGASDASSGTMMGGMMAAMTGGTMDRKQMRQMMGSSVDFDRMFLQMMIPHHEGAITMAEQALREAEHAELKTLAKTIITSQHAEIEEMQGYLQQWYGGSRR